MINVVIRQAEDAEAFRGLLISKGYTFKKMLKRIFIVDGDIDNFDLKNHDLVLDARAPVNIERKFDTTITADTNIVSQRGMPTSVDNRSWGVHRIIRRKNPFSKEGVAYTSTHNMNFYQTRSGAGVDIYIIDVGMNSNHVDFQGSVTNVNTGETYWDDVQSNQGLDHGTPVTSCAAGRVVGIAREAKPFYVPVLVGLTYSDINLIEEYDQVYAHYMSRAHTNRPAVLNNSWGWDMTFQGSPTPAMAVAIDDMISAGISICISASNTRADLDSTLMLPALTDPDIIVVGATNSQDMPYYFNNPEAIGSAVGSKTTIYAPGQGVAAARGTTTTEYLPTSGTSFSSPYAAGVIACMLEGYQRLTSRAQVQAVKQKLIDNSTKGVLKFNAFYPNSIVHNRLLYLDPHIAIEHIDGLVTL